MDPLFDIRGCPLEEVDCLGEDHGFTAVHPDLDSDAEPYISDVEEYDHASAVDLLYDNIQEEAGYRGVGD